VRNTASYCVCACVCVTSQTADLEAQLKDRDVLLQAAERCKELATSDARAKLQDVISNHETRVLKMREDNSLECAHLHKTTEDVHKTSEESMRTLELQLTSKLSELQENQERLRQSEVVFSFSSLSLSFMLTVTAHTTHERTHARTHTHACKHAHTYTYLL